jgi:hypothetical protein
MEVTSIIRTWNQYSGLSTIFVESTYNNRRGTVGWTETKTINATTLLSSYESKGAQVQFRCRDKITLRPLNEVERQLYDIIGWLQFVTTFTNFVIFIPYWYPGETAEGLVRFTPPIFKVITRIIDEELYASSILSLPSIPRLEGTSMLNLGGHNSVPQRKVLKLPSNTEELGRSSPWIKTLYSQHKEKTMRRTAVLQEPLASTLPITDRLIAQAQVTYDEHLLRRRSLHKQLRLINKVRKNVMLYVEKSANDIA